MSSETQRPDDESGFDEPTFDDQNSDEQNFDEQNFDEPVFSDPVFSDEEADEPAFPQDEPVFEPYEPVFDEDSALDEPTAPHSVFDQPDVPPPLPDAVATPAAPPPVDPGQDEYHWFDGPRATETAPPADRRLGRSLPSWLIGAVGVVAVLALIWLFLANRPQPVEDPPLPTAAPTAQQTPAEAVADPPDTPPPPTATPGPVELPVGANVVVGNTDGAGIRLRNAPGLGGITLAIIEDATPFVVLDAGSEQENYPVQADGYLWYRVRATGGEDEGLVGWAAGDFFLFSE